MHQITARGLCCCGLAALLAIAGCSGAKATSRGTAVHIAAPTTAQVDKARSKQLIGKKAPDFDLHAAVPGAKRLSELRGQTVVLVFHFAACEPSRKAVVGLAKVQNSMSARPFKLIVVNIADSEAQSLEEMKKLGLSLPVVRDESGSISTDYRADAVPLIVVIAPNGKVTYTFLGYGEEAAGEMLGERIQEAMPR
jgi:peroxiredoxin